MLSAELAVGWPAYSLWQNDSRLAQLAGDQDVDVMLSETPNFNGAFLKFGTTRVKLQQYIESSVTSGAYAYVAQVPLATSISSRPGMDGMHLTSLAPLLRDIEVPKQLENIDLHQISLWFCKFAVSTSGHYDPYHNLLVVCTGTKKVYLLSPSSSHLLQPHPVYSESANHCDRDMKGLEDIECVVLDAGDALLIPEGYWHQVESTAGTIAINFWWQSSFEKSLEQLNLYHFRRLTQSLVAKELESEQFDALRKCTEELKQCGGAFDPSQANFQEWTALLDRKPQRGLACFTWTSRYSSDIFVNLLVQLSSRKPEYMAQLLSQQPNTLSAIIHGLEGMEGVIPYSVQEEHPNIESISDVFELLYSTIGEDNRRHVLDQAVKKKELCFQRAMARVLTQLG